MSSRPKFVSLAPVRLKVMPCIMIVRCNSLEERLISFSKLFSGTWSGLIAAVKTFASDHEHNVSVSIHGRVVGLLSGT